MLRSVNSLVLVGILTLSINAHAQNCSEVFDTTTALFLLGNYPPARASLNPWELEQTGQIVRAAEIKDVASEILSRDGTYPVILTRNGDFLFSHRLPEVEIKEGQAYLATHRGLANAYLAQKGVSPEIVFSGELRVIGGRLYSVIDMSGTFHFRTGDFSPPLPDSLLVAMNQLRLDYFLGILAEAGLATPSTIVKNFWRKNQENAPESRRDGHFLAKQVAEFEVACARSAQCMQQFLAIDSVVRRLVEKGGEPYLVREVPIEVLNSWFQQIQLIGMMLNEGVLEAMMQWRTQPQMTQSFVDQLPQLSADLGL